MDIFDPETWKQPAALFDYWKSIAGGAIAIFGILGAATKKGREFVRWGLLKLRRSGRTPPHDLRFVIDDRATFWGLGTSAGRPITMVHGRWHVTKISESNVRLLRARLRRIETQQPVVITESPGVIAAHRMVQVEASFMVDPPIRERSQSLAADVIFTDNYGDEHRARSVRFPYRGS
jgi:hypothetical protein